MINILGSKELLRMLFQQEVTSLSVQVQLKYSGAESCGLILLRNIMIMGFKLQFLKSVNPFLRLIKKLNMMAM